jgi:membrane-associated protease RseP (regulator of RpoE activity)
MRGPYRTPASVDPDLPLAPFRPAGLDRWLRAVSGAAIVFLLTASAGIISVMREVAQSHTARAQVQAASPGKPAKPKPAKPKPPPPVAETASPPPAIDAPPPPASCGGVASPAAPSPVALSPVALSPEGSPTHVPAELWRRAQALSAAGADLTLSRTTLPMPLVGAGEASIASQARIAYRPERGGVLIEGLPARSAALLAGIAAGDVVTALNGYALTSPDAAIEGYESVHATRIAVLEILRAGRRIVLQIDSRPALPARR